MECFLFDFVQRKVQGYKLMELLKSEIMLNEWGFMDTKNNWKIQVADVLIRRIEMVWKLSQKTMTMPTVQSKVQGQARFDMALTDLFDY